VLQALILLPGVLGAGSRYSRIWDPRDRRLREVGRLLLPNGLAVGVGYAGFIVDTSFASRAHDPSSLAAIHNAWLLVGLPIALLGQAVGQAAFPRLAAHAGLGEFARLRALLLRALLVMVALSLVAIGGLMLLGSPTVRVLFQHGEFTAHDAALTARVLRIYAIGLPACVATEVLVRSLIAMRDPRTQLFSNSGALALRVLLVSLLLGPLQTDAIPAAFAIAAGLESLVLLGIALRRLARLSRVPVIAAVPAGEGAG
jgi:putative peptidoglycan lipid II flippase